MKRLFALSSTLFLAAGCGKDEPAPEKAECQLEAIDLSACQRSTLAGIQAEGVWNVNVELNDGTGSPGTLRLSGGSGPLVLGLPETARTVSADTFFVASDVENDGNTVRYAFAGCQSSGPTQVSGVFRRCVAGQTDLQGTFEAARVSRRTGEEEASGVTLAGETRMKDAEAIPVELAVGNGFAHVVTRNAGLFVYNVSDPTQPVFEASHWPSGEVYNDAALNGDTLYVASSKSGIVIYDVSRPADPTKKMAPTVVKTVPQTSSGSAAVEVSGVALDGNVLYAASPYPNAEVLIYDVTEPRNPKLLKRYFVEGSEPGLGERPLDVTAAGGRLYVSHGQFGLTVSDVTNPATPKLLGRFGGSFSRSAAVGTIDGRTVAFDVGEDWGAHLRVVNVSDPASTYQMGAYRLRSEVSVRAVALSGTRLYVAHYQDGLRVLDVANPGEPLQVGYYNTWREGDAGRGITFFDGLNAVRAPGDGYVYATESSRGLLIFQERQ